MHLKIQYYALMREQAGRSDETIETSRRRPRRSTSSCRRATASRCAREQLKVAVNSEFRLDAPVARGRCDRVHPTGGGRLMRFASRSRPSTRSARAQNCSTRRGRLCEFRRLGARPQRGLAVSRLEYEAFEALAVKEGERIIVEALRRFPIKHALCAPASGTLAIGDMAVWVGVSSAHRGEAFDACRYIIDEVKHRVPIWKKEHYVNGDSGWVNCERCATAHARRSHDHDHDHDHDHVV
jgi:molybdopterin synthase catalytic subunit